MRSITSFGSGNGMAQSTCPVRLKVDMANYPYLPKKRRGQNELRMSAVVVLVMFCRKLLQIRASCGDKLLCYLARHECGLPSLTLLRCSVYSSDLIWMLGSLYS